MRKLSKLQTLCLLSGIVGISFHSLGLLTGNPFLNVVGAFFGRSAAVLMLTCLDKFKLYSLIPLFFALLSVVTRNMSFFYMELLSQGLMYQIISYKTFTKINQYEND